MTRTSTKPVTGRVATEAPLTAREYAANAAIIVLTASSLLLLGFFALDNADEPLFNFIVRSLLVALASAVVCISLWIRHSADSHISYQVLRSAAKFWFVFGATGYLVGFFIPDPAGLWCHSIAIGLGYTGGILWQVGPMRKSYFAPTRDLPSPTGIDGLLPWPQYRDELAHCAWHPDWWERLYDGIDGPRRQFSPLEEILIPEERKSARRIRERHLELSGWSDKAICHAWRMYSKAFHYKEWMTLRPARHPDFLLYIALSEEKKDPLTDVPTQDTAIKVVARIWRSQETGA